MYHNSIYFVCWWPLPVIAKISSFESSMAYLGVFDLAWSVSQYQIVNVWCVGMVYHGMCMFSICVNFIFYLAPLAVV